jgi:predicted aspartyl protease
MRVATVILGLCAGVALLGASPELAGIQPSYRLKLGTFVTPPNHVVGLMVRARVNGGPLLRLLLDSGTQYVALDRGAARKSGCTGGRDLDLVGAGAGQAGLAKSMTAESVAIGDLTLRNVPLLVTDHKLADGIDGAMPLSLFDGFLVRLDLAAKTLELYPYPSDGEDTTGAVKAALSNRLVFLKGQLNGDEAGYFLLDTGASYNAIARNLGGRMSMAAALVPAVSVRGANGALDAPLFPDAVRLRFGSVVLQADPVVAIDLSIASRYHKLEVAGLIGYPALRDSVVTIDYRDVLVWIEPK